MFKNIFILMALATVGQSAIKDRIESPFKTPEDPFAGTRGLIDNAISSLQQTATQAGVSVSNFTAGIQSQVQNFREDLVSNVNTIQQTIQQAVSVAANGVTSASNAVLACVTNTRKEVESVVNEAVHSAANCADSQLENVISQVSSLITITKYAADAAEEIRVQVLACGNSSSNANVFEVGRCLGAVLWETNIKAATINGQSALLIARINLSVVSLLASLNVCVVTELPSALSSVAQLSQNLAKCSETALNNIN